MSQFFVKEIKVDGLFKCTTQLIMMKLPVFLHIS